MTGVEAIQKILEDVGSLTDTIKAMQASINLIEANIKMLNNRAAGLMRDQPAIAKMVATPDKQLFAEVPKPNVLSSSIQNDEPGIMTYKKVFGKLIDNANEPISSVLIKIYDKNNEVCASTETDPAGYWESMVRPGRYVAEYLKAGFKAANKTFEVGKNMKEVEVK